ncbi:MAG: family 20 glycosylhydrolase [Oscillospiraceae bacterium]|nr:family 20 glycosylhydrolase [Oscillospiraceae bacterium]
MNCDRSKNGVPFKRFATGVDCSRNSVMTVDALKRWIDLISAMGYNTMTIYTEDTYELEGHPYFGYARGRYTKAELKEINAYAKAHGVEVVPQINTLAHLATIFRWKHYSEINDCADILLCEDERTYELIEAMISTCAECFDSRVIGVAMDEAELLGRGKYLKLNGYTPRLEVLKRHMARVCAITDKYGYQTMLVSGDMPFRLATHSSSYSDTTAVVQEDVSGLMPQNAALMYWDYYKRDKEDYKALIRIHKQIKADNLWYLGGVWTWHAFNPENYYSTRALRNSMQACVEEQVENVKICTFGDDGGECAHFASMAGLFYASQIAKGITDEDEIKKNFEELFEIPYDAFLLLDLTQRSESEEYCVHPTRYILYNDPFIGLMDPTIPDYARADHEELVKLLTPWCDHPRWGYLFETMRDLCAVTAEKCDIGILIRAAYKAGDKAKLAELAGELRHIRDLVRKFHKSFRRQWMMESKPIGFEVSDARIGGVMTRLDTCADRLEEYVSGALATIDELEMEQLDPRTPSSPAYGVKKYLNYWDRNSRYYSDIVSACVTDRPE